MKTTRMPPLDLAAYGSAWTGWTLGPWGRSSCAWLFAPNGTRLGPDEILSNLEIAPNVDYLRSRVRELQSNGLDPHQRIAVLAAIQALEQILKTEQHARATRASRARALANVTPAIQHCARP